MQSAPVRRGIGYFGVSERPGAAGYLALGQIRPNR